MSSTVAVLGHVDRLRDRPGDERLGRGHHQDVGLPGDVAGAVRRLERGVEDRQVLGLEIGGPFDRVFLVDVVDDRGDLRRAVAEGIEGLGHGLVDDLHHPAAGQLLVFDQGDVGLDAGRVAVHHEADRPGRGEHRGLGVAEAVTPALDQHFVPDLAGGDLEILRAAVDVVHVVPVHFHDVEHRRAVVLEGVERANRRGQLRAGAERRPVHQGRDRAGQAPGLVRIVGEPAGHEQAAEVRVAQADRPVAMAVGGDPLRGVAGVIDQHLLGDEDQPASGSKR